MREPRFYRLLIAVVVGGVFVTLPNGAVAGDNCPKDLEIKLDNAKNGTLYFQRNGWQKFESSENVGKRGKVHFVYVIKSTSARTGVLVVKSGRKLAKGELALEKNMVKLARYAYGKGKLDREEYCLSTNISNDWHGKVSSESYDQYHTNPNYTSNIKEKGLLREKFHVQYYSSRTKSCIRTDDPDPKNEGSSNLWQYSFNKDLVDGPNAVSAYWENSFPAFLRKLLAGPINHSKGLEMLKVLSLPFHTDDKGLTCISFIMPLTGKNDFIRIQDLEGRTPYLKRWNEDRESSDK